MLSATEIIPLLPFPFGCLLFFSCQTAVVRTSSISMTRSGNSGHPCLLPELNQRKSYQSFTNDYAVHCVLFLCGFYYGEVIAFYS